MILIVLVPLLVLAGVVVAVAQIRRWTVSQEDIASSSEHMDSIVVGGCAFIVFVGVTLIVSEGAELQGYVVSFLVGPFVLFVGYFYPRALRAQIAKLKSHIAELESG